MNFRDSNWVLTPLIKVVSTIRTTCDPLSMWSFYYKLECCHPVPTPSIQCLLGMTLMSVSGVSPTLLSPLHNSHTRGLHSHFSRSNILTTQRHKVFTVRRYPQSHQCSAVRGVWLWDEMRVSWQISVSASPACGRGRPWVNQDVSTVRAVTQTHALLWLLCTENLIQNHIYNIPELKPICRPETRGASEPRADPSRSEYKDMDARFSYPTTILQYNTPPAAWASKTLMCLCNKIGG